MKHLALAVLLALTSVGLLAQTVPPSLKFADVRWTDAVDGMGHHTRVPVFSRAASDPSPPLSGRFSLAEPSAVLVRDEQWQQAKVAGDFAALEGILGEDFSETSDDAVSRNKSQTFQLWSVREISALSTERATIRISAGIATITGEQVEVGATSTDRMIFARVYVQSPSTGWKLLSSTRIRSPK
jgi:hypothetical protein